MFFYKRFVMLLYFINVTLAQVCDDDEIKCKNSMNCIKPIQICDGNIDCMDKSDEVDCNKQITKPSSTIDREATICDFMSQYQCNSGECIDRALRCDDNLNCHDGSDELNCTVTLTCPAKDWKCTNGGCLLKDYVCDKVNGCSDASDEEYCNVSKTNATMKEISTTQSTIQSQTTYQCDDNSIIDDKYRCDGKNDCSSGEDEYPCDYETEFGCEGGVLQIKCDENKKISIIYAIYGRTLPMACQWDESFCNSTNATEFIKKGCQDKNECYMDVESNLLGGDPCEKTHKYLEAVYRCV